MIKLLVTILLIVLLVPTTAEAHLGGGPPFLKINGKDAQTNPYNQGPVALNISWDIPPETYVVNKPITFVLDVAELMKATTVPPEYEKDIDIRWSYATGDNFDIKDESFDKGKSITKTFTEIGSHLVIIEAKLPADSDFILINTVQIDVLPNETYQIPSASAYIGTQNDDSKKNALLVSESTTDPSVTITRYLWDFGDGTLQEGKSVSRRFEKVDSVGIETIFHRIIDEKGFVSDVGFVAEKQNDKLQFAPFNFGKSLPVTVGTYEEASQRAGKSSTKLGIPVFIGVAIGIIIVIGGVWWFVLKRRMLFHSRHSGK